MKNLRCLFFLFAIGSAAKGQSLKMDSLWKFSQGDSPQWAQPAFKDSGWKSIRVGQAWEMQGYKGYDGYAWYRRRIIIPSSLKDRSTLKDLIRFNFGAIDNYDQCFLNGQLIGQNGITVTDTLPNEGITQSDVQWNTSRIYILRTDDKRILWDRPNIIAVRVFDSGGNGGMSMGVPTISMVDVGDYLRMNVKDLPFVQAPDGNEWFKSVRIVNLSERYSFRGQLHIVATAPFRHKKVLDSLIPVTVDPSTQKDISFTLNAAPKETVVLNYYFVEERSGRKLQDREYLPYFLTPPQQDRPRINSPAVFGARTDHPIFFTIAASGQLPLKYEASQLPTGLTLDSSSGLISGRLRKKGTFFFVVKVSNAKGWDERREKIIVGEKIGLTPPMGWNSYYCYWNAATGSDIMRAAEGMVDQGLDRHGYRFCNIDDGWEGTRDPLGVISPNQEIGDMRKLGDFIHSKGLKFGIYSSPGPRTCGGFAGSWGYESNDARSYAKWGVDYLKYDWCSYDDVIGDKTQNNLEQPYLRMRSSLDSLPRDILFSLCQYGMGEVWVWGARAGGNLWRTGYDITDSWGSLKPILLQQNKFSGYGGPGGWNDPDMLQVGWFRGGRELHPSNLTVPEQYSQFSMWCLMSAPLLLSCDLTKFDKLARSLATNDEVIALDQDALGKPAQKIADTAGIHIYLKVLADSTRAVGIFNFTDQDTLFHFNFSIIGADQFLDLTDLWQQKPYGTRKSSIEVALPAHGCALYKIRRSSSGEMKSYHESWVRYLMADMLLGGDMDYYREFADDPNSVEALRRLDNGVSVVNCALFERKMIPGKNMLLVKKGTNTVVTGNNISLSTDGLLDESKVRSFMVQLENRRYLPVVTGNNPAEAAEALIRNSLGVKVLGAHRNRSGHSDALILSSDQEYDRDAVCYMLADMSLGGTVGFYKKVFDSSRDPNSGEALRCWEAGVRISNLREFARVDLPGKGIKIVWKGTTKIISGKEIRITKSRQPSKLNHPL